MRGWRLPGVFGGRRCNRSATKKKQVERLYRSGIADNEGSKAPKFCRCGVKTVNALLKWIRQMDGAVSSPAAESKAAEPAIAYED